MKPRVVHQKTAALTLVEVVVVMAVFVILVAIVLTSLSKAFRKAPQTACAYNLKQISLGCQIWAQDNKGKYPMEVPIVNGGVMELATTGNVVAIFQILSNQLSTPKILFCPLNAERIPATDFSPHLTAKNISYFVGLDASSNSPRGVLAGDNNFMLGDSLVNSGIMELTKDFPVTWTKARHVGWIQTNSFESGNVVLVDGSVKQKLVADELREVIHQTGLATNRLAIP
jgi:type II secretory pathway pseudopilin PulG